MNLGNHPTASERRSGVGIDGTLAPDLSGDYVSRIALPS
jgi:hypothetical protein